MRVRRACSATRENGYQRASSRPEPYEQDVSRAVAFITAQQPAGDRRAPQNARGQHARHELICGRGRVSSTPLSWKEISTSLPAVVAHSITLNDERMKQYPFHRVTGLQRRVYARACAPRDAAAIKHASALGGRRCEKRTPTATPPPACLYTRSKLKTAKPRKTAYARRI